MILLLKAVHHWFITLVHVVGLYPKIGICFIFSDTEISVLDLSYIRSNPHKAALNLRKVVLLHKE